MLDVGCQTLVKEGPGASPIGKQQFAGIQGRRCAVDRNCRAEKRKTLKATKRITPGRMKLTASSTGQ
jgi:hypothetical protein